MNKKRRNFNLTDEAYQLLQQIADQYGVNKTAALEIVMRQQAELLHDPAALRRRADELERDAGG